MKALIAQDQRSAKFLFKGLDSKYVRLCKPCVLSCNYSSVYYHPSTKAAKDDTEINECGYVATKLYYGQGNVDFIYFSCVMKYSSSFYLFQPFRNVKTIFFSQAIQTWAGPRLSRWVLICQLLL